jgi:mono/diheme cytochrome c family protein
MRRGVLLLALGALMGSASGKPPDGRALFTQNCALCHQIGATGLPGQFPRLAGRVGPISATSEGRAYLVDVLTYGMAGQVTVDGQPILGAMPSFASLPDEQVAAILGYLSSLGGGNGKLPTAHEVASLRTRDKKSPTDVLAERRQLAAAGIVQ